MKKNLKTFLLTVISVVVAMLSVELALYLRSKKITLPELIGPGKVDNKLSLLIISDSVMGKEQDVASLAYNIKNELQKNPKVQTQLINKSEPALSAWRANFMIDEYLEIEKPNAALIMLGNSDFIVFSDTEKTIGRSSFKEMLLGLKTVAIAMRFLSIIDSKEDKTKIPRGKSILDILSDESLHAISMFKSCAPLSLAETKPLEELHSKTAACFKEKGIQFNQNDIWFYFGVLFKEKKKFDVAIEAFEQARSNNGQYLSATKELYWLLIEKEDHPKAIAIFEEYIKKGAPDRKTMLKARDSYLKLNKVEQAIAVYLEIANNKNQPEQVSVTASHIAQSLSYIVRPEKKATTRSRKGTLTREEYLTELFGYKYKNDKTAANDLYRRLNEIEMPEDQLHDEKSLLLLIEKLQNANVQVFLTQYPNQPVWPLLQTAKLASKSAAVIDLHEKVSLHLQNNAIYDFFEDDLMHLSKKGADVFGKIIAEEIEFIVHKQGGQ